MTRRFRRILVGIVTLVAVATASWALVLRAMKLRGDQVMNCSELGVHSEAVQRFHQSHGRYPASLEEAIQSSGFSTRNGAGRDIWGNQMIYQTDGNAFMIVSLGKDGRSDATDFWALVGTPVADWKAEEVRCGNPNAYAMVSGNNRTRACCK
jgi:hypothetical protein